MEFWNSATFWAAVGSIAAVAAVVIGLLQWLSARSNSDQSARRPNTRRPNRSQISASAEDAARKFDYWMNNYNHHGNHSDREKTVEWLYADRGHLAVGENYKIFSEMCRKLSGMGYRTLPAPSESEFSAGIQEAERR